MSRHTIAFVLALAAAGAPSSKVYGQAAGAAKPAAGAAPAAAAAAAPGEPGKYADPAVQALMDTDPQTPLDQMNVILLLLDLKQPKPAKIIFDKLYATEIDEPGLVALGKKIGMPGIYRLAEVTEFRPNGGIFARKVEMAMNSAARNPDRLAELIERLKEKSLDVRVAAIDELRQGREAAALALVNVLQDPTRLDEHAGVRAALASLGNDGIEPLGLIALRGSESDRTAALTALGMTDDHAARPALYSAAFGSENPSIVRQVASQGIVRGQGKLPSPIGAAAELYLDAKRLYLTRPTQLDRMIEAGAIYNAHLWQWNAAAKKPELVTTKPRVVALAHAARLAEIAADITGRDPHAVTLAQAASLEAAMSAPETAKPQAAPAAEAPAADAPADPDAATAKPAATNAAAAPDTVGQWNVDVKPTAAELRRLIEFTAANDRAAATAAAIRLHVTAEGIHALEGIGGRPSTLVKLMTHPDRKIRFAALDAIIGLNPQQPFTGSSAVADALGYFAASTGTPKAIVADPNLSRARDIGGIVTSMGARADVATSARDAVRMVSADPDISLAVIYRPLLLAELGQLLAQFRADYRTARLPVVVYCEPNDVERTRTLIASDPLAIAIYQPRTLEQLGQQIQNFTAAKEGLVPPEARAAQARRALSAMTKLLAMNNKVFNLRPYETVLLNAAWNPTTSGETIGALAGFGSPSTQRTLADLASANTWPIDARVAAAHGFRESVGRFGTLLTTSEISQQYDRYNAAATADKGTQEVLADLLDTIEARAVKVPGGSTLPPPVVTQPPKTLPLTTVPAASVTPPAAKAPPAGTAPAAIDNPFGAPAKGAKPAAP